MTIRTIRRVILHSKLLNLISVKSLLCEKTTYSSYSFFDHIRINGIHIRINAFKYEYRNNLRRSSKNWNRNCGVLYNRESDSHIIGVSYRVKYLSIINGRLARSINTPFKIDKKEQLFYGISVKSKWKMLAYGFRPLRYTCTQIFKLNLLLAIDKPKKWDCLACEVSLDFLYDHIKSLV